MTQVVKPSFSNSKIGTNASTYSYNSASTNVTLKNDNETTKVQDYNGKSEVVDVNINYSPISSPSIYETDSASSSVIEVIDTPIEIDRSSVIEKIDKNTGARESTGKASSIFEKAKKSIKDIGAKIAETVSSIFGKKTKPSASTSKYDTSGNWISVPFHYSGYTVNNAEYYPYGEDGEVVAPGYTTTYHTDAHGNVIGMITGDIYCKVDGDNKHYYRYNKNNNTLSPINIFDEANLASGQYGGDQSSFHDNFEQLIQDPFIWEEMQKYFPVESFASEEEAMSFYKNYFNQIESTGCGYIAMTNAIFSNYTGREEEFESIFHFPMYEVDERGNVDFNYEKLSLMLFNEINANDIKKKYDANKLIFNSVGEHGYYITNKGKDLETGASGFDMDDMEKYLNNLGVDYDNSFRNRMVITGTNLTEKAIDRELYSMYRKNDAVIIAAKGYDLYDMDGNLSFKGDEGHAMQLVGFTDEGKPIVSSWGEKYVLDPNSSIGETSGFRRFSVNLVNFKD